MVASTELVLANQDGGVILVGLATASETTLHAVCDLVETAAASRVHIATLQRRVAELETNLKRLRRLRRTPVTHLLD